MVYIFNINYNRLIINYLVLNNNFREYRKSKKLTQKEFADLLEVPQSQVSAIENGKLGISKHVASKLKSFDKNIDIDYLEENVKVEIDWKDLEIERLNKELEEMRNWRDLLEITLKGPTKQ